MPTHQDTDTNTHHSQSTRTSSVPNEEGGDDDVNVMPALNQVLAGMAYGSGHDSESENGEEKIQSIIDVDDIEESAESELSRSIIELYYSIISLNNSQND